MQPSKILGHLCAFVLVAPVAAQTLYFNASLDGSQEVPPVTTRASGWATVRLNTTTRRVDILVHSTGVVGTAAHLHLARRGANGGVIVPLRGGPSTFSGGAVLSAAHATSLRNGGTYVNVHSAANRGGEIRGQVEAARVTRYVAALDGRQEVPPNNSTATGQATLLHYEPSNVLTYEVRTRGLTRVTAAHIHAAAAGRNGRVIHPLTGSAGAYCGSAVLTTGQVTALKARGLYVNVHTSGIPAGEIRGQILASAGDFGAVLEGKNEVPPVRTLAHGSGCVTLNSNNTLSYVVTTSGLTGTAAHFHRAAAGTNGPVVIPLTGGPSVWRGTTRPLTATELADLRRGLWYVNVHTSTNRGGEIRDQLTLGTLPKTYGGGCPAGTRLAQITATGFPCLGNAFEVHARNATPNVSCELFLGTDRDRFGSAILPFHLRIIGMPDCFLLTDIALRGFVTRTDANGCATVRLPFPLLPAFRGVEFNAQWLFLVPRTNPAGGVVSNALRARIQ